MALVFQRAVRTTRKCNRLAHCLPNPAPTALRHGLLNRQILVRMKMQCSAATTGTYTLNPALDASRWRMSSRTLLIGAVEAAGWDVVAIEMLRPTILAPSASARTPTVVATTWHVPKPGLTATLAASSPRVRRTMTLAWRASLKRTSTALIATKVDTRPTGERVHRRSQSAEVCRSSRHAPRRSEELAQSSETRTVSRIDNTR